MVSVFTSNSLTCSQQANKKKSAWVIFLTHALKKENRSGTEKQVIMYLNRLYKADFYHVETWQQSPF